MDIAVPSRFACLRIEDDDFRPANSNKSKKKTDSKQPQNKKQEKSAKQEPKKNANNGNKSASSGGANKKSKKKQQPNAKQWEEWKQKDDQLVNGNFEEDLQNAILLSKLDYEEKKDLYQQIEKDAKKDSQAGKKKKNKVMSLNQFLEKNGGGNAVDEKENIKVEKDGDFFEKVKKEAKAAFTKEEISHKRKKREANIEEAITIAQYQEKLEKEIAKNAVLQLELDKMKKEIAEVKARNKRLCTILGDGEMKDKADVLLELQRLNGVKNELTEEVTRLHGLLEQERSKVAALSADPQHKHKDKKQKKTGSANK